MSLNPFVAFLKTISYLVRGRLHFPRDRIGEVLVSEDALKFVIFRHVLVDSAQDQPKIPGAIFTVRFRVTNMSPKQNKVFSLLPMPFFVGLPGFRSKLWMLNDTYGIFQGLYEWDTLQDAKNYAHSFAMKFMKKRSVPGSVSYEIMTK